MGHKTNCINQYKIVYVQQTNEYFPSRKEASLALGISTNLFTEYLRGIRVCPDWFYSLRIMDFYPPKMCRLCKCILDTNNTYSHKGKSKVRANICKTCFNKKMKQFTYFGRCDTTEDYDNLVKKNGRHCAICGQLETIFTNGVRNTLSIDHNHNTGKVRGLLCHKCNMALGYLNVDNVGILNLQKAIHYIES